ncbi:vesicular-fusion protein SEC17 [Coniophora puteana RWD-64-598 SS2]|uniref:Vesicular-fusion protein SEC17 n=1 Tax=Coniophora puteana (strain RWD-64-598) TaxID=741705 RepID=A0A5M3N5U9_CONPW|nr:vesicular-fusion protein SEC17 [Coniophora puteana RWD-64-598 SS2]EIW86763.1 vesicular-fusion protein SEC17 [Coniophora puteana RWD-64-598 SS2]
MPSKSPAQTLAEKADKKANSSAGWFSSSSTKFEEAGDLYQQAANAYKLEKQFREAGDAFAREAECREKCKETNEAANAWWNAAKAYKQGHPDLAIQALTQTITHYTHAGRFRQAADREKEIGQLYQNELGDLGKACESYERAAEWYSQEDAGSTANACYKDAADLHADLENYPQAIQRYEQVANHSLASPLTKYSVREYWLRASLCALAMRDTVTAKRNIAKYSSQDVTFTSTRECKFINVLIEAMESENQEAFTAAVVEYDQVTRLDNWKTAILLKVKRGIQETDGGIL